jgi:biuret amidohydrolase
MRMGYGLRIPMTISDLCDPARMALIVYDMQIGIVQQLPDGAEIIARVRTLIDAARDAGYPIFYTRHTSLPNRLAGIGALRRAMVWQRIDAPEETTPAFLADAAATQIVPELAPTPDDVVIDKITMSAFAGTSLDIAMRDKQLVGFAIVGIALEIGIGPTLTHGADLNYVPAVIADACGSGNEDARRWTLDLARFGGDTIVTSSDEILPLLRHASRSSPSIV